MSAKVELHEKFENIYWAIFEDTGEKKLATKNLAPGYAVYGERLIKYKGEEYRLWDPYRSKLAAAILRGINFVPIKTGDRILYLGAATGSTSSHCSDIVGPNGIVYCVEFSPRVLRELVGVTEHHKNMIPLLEDARFPWKYRMLVPQVDVIYQDVAQPEQAKILADNAEFFLKPNGWALLAIKARSVDVTAEPSEVYKKEIETLEKRNFEIKDVVHLEPFDKAHAFLVMQYKP
jgi:fibrillarin-like pre-rRNA processing protein